MKQVVDSDLKSKFELQQNAYVDNFIGNTFVKYNNEEKEEEDINTSEKIEENAQETEHQRFRR